MGGLKCIMVELTFIMHNGIEIYHISRSLERARAASASQLTQHNWVRAALAPAKWRSPAQAIRQPLLMLSVRRRGQLPCRNTRGSLNTSLLKGWLIHKVLSSWNSRQAADWKHLGGHKIYHWRKKYMLAAIGVKTFVCFAEKGSSSSTDDDHNQSGAAILGLLQRVIAKQDVFDAIYPVHAEGGGHKKARSFQTAVEAKVWKVCP
eukprot:6191807-Pleurochrysis_carterae.AAC.3